MVSEDQIAPRGGTRLRNLHVSTMARGTDIDAELETRHAAAAQSLIASPAQ